MNLEQCMDRLKDEVGIDSDFPQGERGAYLLPMDEERSVVVTDLNPGIGLFCQVASCPAHEQEDFFTNMLLANLFGQGTEGAILGLDQDAKHLVLRKEITHAVDYEKFAEEIEDFMNAVDLWTNEVNEQNAA